MTMAVTARDQVLHRARLVLPVAGPPIDNGAVLVRDGRVRGIGPFPRLRRVPGRVEDHGEVVLMPALINCHAHLELSCHAVPANEQNCPHGDMTGWISALLDRRRAGPAAEAVLPAGRAALRGMRERGVAVVADTGNDPAAGAIGHGSAAMVIFMREYLAPTRVMADDVLRRLAREPDGHVTAHALYSTVTPVLRAIKRRCRRQRRVFSVHVAESAEEVRFLRHGDGPFAAFLRRRAAVAEGGAVPPGSLEAPGCGPVELLARLGLLDSQTLCVHGVHLSERETRLLARHQAHVCLCPGSNRYLRVGKAPAARLARAGVNLCLGTDSAASNTSLDLWREMRLLREDAPGLSPENVLFLATLGGARALGLEGRFGSLVPGAEALMLAIDYRGGRGEAADYLTSGDIACKWVT